MKKFVILILGTLLLSSSVFWVGGAVKSNVPTVTICKIEPVTAIDTIICTGKVEYEKSKDIRTTASGIIENVNVKKGESVTKGQVLFTVIPASGVTAQASADISADELYQAFKNGNYAAISSYASSTADNSEIPANNSGDEIIEIKSPIDGEILEINESTGSAIGLATTVMTVVSGNNLCVKLPVNESKIADLALDQKAIITGNGFKNSVYSGTVSYIDKIAQQVSTAAGKETAVDVKVKVNDPQDDIKPGYSAKCEITTFINENSIIVPYDAITRNDDGKEFIYVCNTDKAEIRYIKTGNEYKNGVEVIKGISVGEQVIITPEKVKDAETVKVTKQVVNTYD
ncbi:hypothetical protein AGMMS50284_1400 [Clostridia bacterium]|nr:hypothetical protein AGMMS50284_1400 [Clostridia bacterium]